MRSSMNRLVLIVLTTLVSLAFAGARPSPAYAQDNTAVAINLHDGAEIFRLAFKIARVNQDVVDHTNAAVAFASCAECDTVAIAIQAVLIFSDPSVVAPTNLALAYNLECTGCETLASAYQWVFTTGGPVHFTADGNRRIAEIRRRLLELLRSDLTIAEIQAELDILMEEFESILATELVPAGQAPTVPAGGEPTETTTTTTTETATTETTTTEPTETTATEPTETATTETTTTTP
jgi:putative peptide zinc metalloprotease protein